MKVMVVLEDGRMAGPQSYVLKLIPKLGDIDVDLVIPKKDNDEFCYRLTKANVCYRQIRLCRPQRNLIGLLTYFITFPFDIIRLCRLVRSSKVDLLYAAGGSWQVKAVITACILRRPSIWQMNDTFVPRAVIFLFKLLGKLPSGFVYVSFATKNYYNKQLQIDVPTRVIPSPIDTNEFPPLSDVTLLKKNYDQRRSMIRIGTVCSINPVKNLDYFIDIANELNIQAPDILFDFRVIGPVPKTQKLYFDFLKRKLSDVNLENLVFEGAQRNVVKTLSALDMYLCTSNYEASPIAIWEAMAANIPIISTDVGDVSIHLQNSNCGVIIPFDDPKIAARVILDYHGNLFRPSYKGNNGKEYIKNNLSADICAKAHTELFYEVK